MEKVEGPNYQTVKKQLLEELKDEIFSTEEVGKEIVEQVRALAAFAPNYPISFKTICDLLGIDYSQIEDDILESKSNQRENLGQRFSKIEQLRRNIENTSRLFNVMGSYRYTDYDGEEAAKKDKEYYGKVIGSLEYYVEKLKEETEKMLKE